MAELHDATSLSAAGLPLPKNWLAIIAFIWAGQAASMITSYAAGYAVVWYVTESTGSALMLAAMNIADQYFREQDAAENLRRQIKDNLEEVNQLKMELSEAKREIFKLQNRK